MQLHISVVDHAQLGCLGWASQGINQEDWGNILSCCHSTLWQYWGFSCEPIASTCHVMEPDIASRDLAERWIHLGKTKSLASQSGADKQVVTPWLSQFWGFMLLSHNILGASETEPRAGDVQIWLEDLPHLLSVAPSPSAARLLLDAFWSFHPLANTHSTFNLGVPIL